MASTIPDPHPHTRGVHDMPPPSDRAGRIEVHGIDHIPERERHGRARELFVVWALRTSTT